MRSLTAAACARRRGAVYGASTGLRSRSKRPASPILPCTCAGKEVGLRGRATYSAQARGVGLERG